MRRPIEVEHTAMEACLAREIVRELLEHARGKPDEECCGLLAGRDGVITKAYRARNAAADPARAYEIAPEELFGFVRAMRAEGLALMGIYHSHPNGANQPSPRDIQRAYYPEAAYVLLAPRADAPKPLRAFAIRGGRATEIELRIS